MNDMLPGFLVAAAFGIAVANEGSATRWSGMIVFAIAAACGAFAPMPAIGNERLHAACWIAVIACSASLHFPRALVSRASAVLALAAGASGGAAAALASARMTVALLPLIAAATWLAARVAARFVPVAPRVVSSWLIAVALLAATLQMLPVTPGYLPDHLE